MSVESERIHHDEPSLEARLETAWQELGGSLEHNRAASVLVNRESAKTVSEAETQSRQIMMASLGVRDHQVEVYDDERFPDGKRYQERIITNLPGVEIVYADQPDGGRAISLAVNHLSDDIKRVLPTDIQRVLKTAYTYQDWKRSVEQYGGHWNSKKEAVADAKLLSIDIDDCVLPSVDRRPADVEMLTALAAQLKSIEQSGLTPFLNTGRSAVETEAVLDYLTQLGAPLYGAIAETGAISIKRGEDGHWLQERNPTIDDQEWAAVQLCRDHIRTKYVDSRLGWAEPKVSAVTFNLVKDSGQTGYGVIEELRAALAAAQLPTAIVDRADVSEGGLQLFAGGIDKAAGMRYIQSQLGATKEQTIAVGDSPGDLPMFSEAGITAVPFNAAMALRQEADYYSPFDTESGVLDIVNQIAHLRQDSTTTDAS